MAVRDKEWLTLEACREFQRGTCSRTDQECKYAHPSNSVVVENGRVIACYDSMKGQCTRENCRYLHPPPHLKTQLEIKGQNNIAARRMLQNAALQNQLLGQPGTAIPIQPTLLQTVPTSLQSGTSPVAATTSQANLEISPATAAAAYQFHGHHPYMIPVAVTMAPTMSHSTLSQHMYPSYLSQAVQTALPTVATSTTVPGAGTNAHPGFSEIPIQAPIIPSAPGAPFQFFPVKTKNDRLELPTTNRKRPREEDDQLLLMWNYLKDDPNRWQSSTESSNYLQNHQSLSACLPRPAKMQASMIPQPPLAQSPIYPSNLVYNPLAPMTVMAQPQFLPAPLPMMPASFPFLPHILHNQNTSETLPVCRDFKSGNCKRPNCKYAHVMEDKVEIVEGKVTLCRDAAKGKCMRTNCKYYHVPGTNATNGILPATANAVTAASATTY